MKLFVILFTILASNQIADGYRILGVFPLQGKSHWVMMEQLMKGLAKRGHQVDVITHFPQKKPIPNYTDISVAGSLPAVVNNISATDLTYFCSGSMIHLTYVAGTTVCELLDHPKLRDIIENPPQDPPYDILITELFMSPCFLAFGRHLKVPMVTILTSAFHDWLNEVSGNPASYAFVPGIFSGYSQNMNFKERLINFVFSSWISMQMHYYTDSQRQIVKKSFGIDVSDIKDLYQDISLYLVNSHHSLQGIRPFTSAVIEVSGLHINENDDPLSPEVQKWLDESKDGCVYFTFGSMLRIETFPKELMEQFYASFKKIAPVRVLMKVAVKKDLLPGLPENVMTQSWFPQVSVLKHKNIRAFMTHGGLMGTTEAVYCGVPMIGIPIFGDQAINIQNYVHKKVAISLNSPYEVTEEKLTSVLNTILKDPFYRENVQKLSKIFVDRPTSALNTSVYWVEYVAKYGNVLQSPAIHLYWWQRNLLDVYCVIVIVIITVLYLVVFTLLKVKKFFGSRVCAKKNDAAIKSKKNK